VRRGDDLWMYYVGFQLQPGVKFLAFSGLAASRDNGLSFQRVAAEPILEPAPGARCIRAIHSVAQESAGWRAWYASGDDWEFIDGAPYPRYHIRSIASPDGLVFEGAGAACLMPVGDEYRIGRPRVYHADGRQVMFFTKGTRRGDYLMGYADSVDGATWVRRDDDIGLGPSGDGWESDSVCYPALIAYRDSVYMFYNGNGMGRTGFGFASLVNW
jgi:hypothetical protein